MGTTRNAAGTPGEAAVGAGAAVPITVALRRVVVGFRVVSALWVVVLGVVAAAAGGATVAGLVGPLALAVGWAVATVAAERAGRLAEASVLAVDVTVAGALVLWQGAVVGDAAGFLGGYPFSSVVLVAATAGMWPGIAAALLLSAVSLAVPLTDAPGIEGVGEAASTVLLYVLGAATVAWSAAVIRSHDLRQRSVEAALADERARRVRSQERAETAAHLHDSVLQVLALVQRRAEDPAEVVRLARGQERQLRAWLLDDNRTPEVSPVRLLESLAAEVEGRYGVRVDLVTVGEAPVTPATTALVAAVGEAMTNAARHAGVGEVSVLVSAETDEVRAFVRDRGAGFDPGSVDGARRGVRDSIEGRMARNGGRARLRTSPGRGTEWELAVPAGARPGAAPQ